MTRNFYELLGVEAAADAGEIKRAFRREIARYHPDKVQHLGQEFQEIAASRAAALTEAYRILSDDEARRRYDEGPGPGPRAEPAAPTQAPAAADQPEAAEHRSDARVEQARATTSDFVRKAALRMVREAIVSQMSGVTELSAPGFESAFVVNGKRTLFGKKEPVIRLLARFVPQVDPSAVAEAWPLAVAATAQGQGGCVLLLGGGINPARELGSAVVELRRATRGQGPVIVPVDVRDWDALVPPETPASVRAVLQKLKETRG